MRTRLLKGLVVGTVCAVGGILLLKLCSSERVIPLHDGGTIRIKATSLLGRWLSWSTCVIKYQPSNGPSGTITLTDSEGDYPVLIIPEDGGKVLCLYQLEDMCCQLVRFDTTKHFKPVSSRGHLDEIVRSSPWEVEVGSLDDFKYLCDFVKNMTTKDIEKNSFPTFAISRLSEVNKSDLSFDLNGVGLNWDSLHR